jgi:N-acetylneuraminate synthase
MVFSAYKSGAEIIKHQTHIVDDEMSPHAKNVIPGNETVSIYEVIKRCSLSEEDEIALQKYTESLGLIFISTPFSRSALERLIKMDIPAFKIGSGECNNYPLVRLIAQTGKPIIMSTGMNNIESIRKSVNIIREYNTPFALLHCTNIYPTPHRLVRLAGVTRLKEEFPDAVVGLSDHTVDNYACLASVALGASVLERHFTDDKARPGPDIVCSMDPEDLKDMIVGSKAIFAARGGEKEIAQEEQVTADFAFGSVVADRDIEKGKVITEKDIWVRRPGTGQFSAEDYEKLIGLTAKCLINKNEQISHEHLK